MQPSKQHIAYGGVPERIAGTRASYNADDREFSMSLKRQGTQHGTLVVWHPDKNLTGFNLGRSGKSPGPRV